MSFYTSLQERFNHDEDMLMKLHLKMIELVSILNESSSHIKVWGSVVYKDLQKKWDELYYISMLAEVLNFHSDVFPLCCIHYSDSYSESIHFLRSGNIDCSLYQNHFIKIILDRLESVNGNRGSNQNGYFTIKIFTRYNFLHSYSRCSGCSDYCLRVNTLDKSFYKNHSGRRSISEIHDERFRNSKLNSSLYEFYYKYSSELEDSKDNIKAFLEELKSYKCPFKLEYELIRMKHHKLHEFLSTDEFQEVLDLYKTGKYHKLQTKYASDLLIDFKQHIDKFIEEANEIVKTEDERTNEYENYMYKNITQIKSSDLDLKSKEKQLNENRQSFEDFKKDAEKKMEDRERAFDEERQEYELESTKWKTNQEFKFAEFQFKIDHYDELQGKCDEQADEIKTLKKEIEKLNNELTLTKKRCKKLQTAIDIMKE